MRHIFLSALIGAAAIAAAQVNYDPVGIMNFEQIRVRQADGSYKIFRNVKLPYYAEPVGKTRKQVEKMIGGPIPANPFKEQTAFQDAPFTVYQNNRPNSYFGGTGEGSMPSALDDLEIVPAGVNAGVLDLLTVGWSIPNRQSVFPVFGFYDDYIPGSPTGQSAFTNIIVDSFGGPWSASPTLFPQVPGDYLVSFGQTIQFLGIQFDDPSAYFFQQFHISAWNGPMNPAWSMFYSGGGLPQVGNSQDRFWYDANPEDAIYADEEMDLFSTEPNHSFQANFACELRINSNFQTVTRNPFTITPNPGSQVSGSFSSTWSNNSVYYVGRPELVNVDDEYPLGLVCVTESPTPNLVSLTFTVDAKMSVTGGEQVVSLYNYALQTWVTFDRGLLNPVDRTVTFTVGSNPSQYCHPTTGEMMAYLQYRELISEEGDFRTSLDEVRWNISYQ